MTDRKRPTTPAGPLASLIITMTDAELQNFADAMPALTDADHAAADEFRQRLESMTDEQIHAQWGIASPQLIADIRDLFAAPRRA